MKNTQIKNYVDLTQMSNDEIKSLFNGWIGKEILCISDNDETYGMGVTSHHVYRGILKENEFIGDVNVRNHFELDTLKRFNMFSNGRSYVIDSDSHPYESETFQFHQFFNTYFSETDEVFMWVVDNTVYHYIFLNNDVVSPEKQFKTYNLILNLGFDVELNKDDIKEYVCYTFLNSQSLYFDLKYNEELNNMDIDSMTNFINNFNKVENFQKQLVS